MIEYLKTPPSRERLIELSVAMKITPRQLLREKGTPFTELGLGDPKWSDVELAGFGLSNNAAERALRGIALGERRGSYAGPGLDEGRVRESSPKGTSSPKEPIFTNILDQNCYSCVRIKIQEGVLSEPV